MKEGFQVIALVVLSFFAAASVTKPRTDVELSEDFKTDDSFPFLNNIILPPITINCEDFYMALSELTLEGFENMSVKKLSPSLYNLSMSIEVVVPELTIRADFYQLAFGKVIPWIGFIKLVDDVGELRCYINNLAVRGTVQLGTNNGDTDISSLDLVYSFRGSKVELSGSAFWVNVGVANRNALNFLNNEDLMKIIRSLIKDQTKPYLLGYTPLEFIHMIGNNLN